MPFVAWAVDLSFSFFLFLRGKQNGDVRISSRRPGKGSTSTTAAAAAVAEVVDTDTQHLSSREGPPFHEYEYYFVRPRPASQRRERALLPGLSWTVSHSQSPTQPLTRPIVHEEDEECLDTRAPQYCTRTYRPARAEHCTTALHCVLYYATRRGPNTATETHRRRARQADKQGRGEQQAAPCCALGPPKRMAMCRVMDKAQAGRSASNWVPAGSKCRHKVQGSVMPPLRRRPCWWQTRA